MKAFYVVRNGKGEYYGTSGQWVPTLDFVLVKCFGSLDHARDVAHTVKQRQQMHAYITAHLFYDLD